MVPGLTAFSAGRAGTRGRGRRRPRGRGCPRRAAGPLGPRRGRRAAPRPRSRGRPRTGRRCPSREQQGWHGDPRRPPGVEGRLWDGPELADWWGGGDARRPRRLRPEGGDLGLRHQYDLAEHSLDDGIAVPFGQQRVQPPADARGEFACAGVGGPPAVVGSIEVPAVYLPVRIPAPSHRLTGRTPRPPAAVPARPCAPAGCTRPGGRQRAPAVPGRQVWAWAVTNPPTSASRPCDPGPAAPMAHRQRPGRLIPLRPLSGRRP
jgi:hypothetical protein